MGSGWGVEIEEGIEDLVNLGCELAGWGHDYCADMVLLEGLVDVEELFDNGY